MEIHNNAKKNGQGGTNFQTGKANGERLTNVSKHAQLQHRIQRLAKDCLAETWEALHSEYQIGWTARVLVNSC